MALYLSVVGLAVYFKDSQNQLRKGMDLASSLGTTFEKIVTYASPAVAIATIEVHIAIGKYDG